MAARKGEPLNWLKAHVAHQGGECLPWPYSRNHQGYGQVLYEGKIKKAHNVMCRLAHGEPPTPTHQASHSCGKGHEGCIHPGHLSWKTPSENRLESTAHGTGNKPKGPRLKIETVRKILESPKSYLEIAEEFGIYFGRVAKIKRGETWKRKLSVPAS